MLEDKGISLEGKRCLITGSDSVSTVHTSDLTHVVYLFLSISHSNSFHSIVNESSSFSTSPFLSFLFLILPSFFLFFFISTYLPTSLASFFRFFLSSSSFFSLLPSFFSSYLPSLLLSLLFLSHFFAFLTSLLFSLLCLFHFL